MAPKAAEKKAAPKKAITYAPKEIDASKYIRKQETLELAGEVAALAPHITGLTANVESLYPEWSTENQNWQDIVDGDESVKYPLELRVRSQLSIRNILNLEAVTESKAKKGDVKKPKEAVAEVLIEVLQDEEGRDLPRIYSGDDTTINEYYRPFQFKKGYSKDQLERKAFMETLSTRISALNNSSDASAAQTHIIEKKAELQLQYDTYIAERDVRTERPCGPELDPCMCSAYRIITEFAVKNLSSVPSPLETSLESSSASLSDKPISPDTTDKTVKPDKSVESMKPARLLWNSIYPQLPSGRPIYNPSGKYAVRLYLAGKWRKVLVTDMVPVNGDGVVLASSEEAMELWPMLLAKAVYSVYTACGYNYSLPTLTDTPGQTPSPSPWSPSAPSPTSETHKTSFFTSFAVHILTGWQPSTPRSLSETIDQDIHRARGLLQEMLFGGVSNLSLSEIPSVAPPVLKMGGGLSGGDIVPSDLLKYQTKRQFKEEYSIRFAERARVLQEIEMREGQAKRLNEALLRPFSEGFVLSLQPCTGVSGLKAGHKGGHKVGSNGTEGKDESVGDIVGEGHGEGEAVGGEGDGERRRVGGSLIGGGVVLTIPILGIYLPSDSDDVIHSDPSDRESDVTVSTNELLRFIHSEGEGEADFNILKNVRLLTKWRTSPGVPLGSVVPAPIKGIEGDDGAKVVPNAIPDDLIELLHGINDPLPLSTVIESEWITLEELARRQAFVVGFDTNTRLPHQAILDWQWSPIDEMKGEKGEKGDKGGGDKGSAMKAGSKGKITGEQFRSVNQVSGDPGTAPPLLLSLSTKKFFLDESSSLPSSARTAIDEAIKAQEIEMRNFAGTSGKGGRCAPTPLSSYLSISLSLHADLIVPEEIIETSISPRLSARRKSTMKGSRTMSQAAIIVSSDAKADLTDSGPNPELTPKIPVSNMLPSDVVVILQELRKDGKEPLVMRIELSENAKIPFTRTTFHIPSDRIDQQKDNLVFWVRLFSKASVHLSVSCAVPVVLGEVEAVWSSIGGNVLVKEGEAGVTRGNTEQLLFRIPLQLKQLSGIGGVGGISGDMGRSYDDESSEERKGEIPLTVTVPNQSQGKQGNSSRRDSGRDGGKDFVNDQVVTAFLHISDRQIARSVSILLLSQPDRNGTPDSFTMPRIDGNNFMLSGTSRSMKILIGRIFPLGGGPPGGPGSREGVTFGEEGPVGVLPEFKWKLVIISSVPLVDTSAMVPVPSQSIVRSLQQRYKGVYKPNNRLVLFRDVYIIDHSSFPVALRIVMSPLRTTSSTAVTAAVTQVVSFGREVNESNERKEDDIDASEDISFIVRIYRKSDRLLISESKGRSVLQLYNITIDGLIPPPTETPILTPGNSDTPTQKGKKEKAPSKKTPEKAPGTPSGAGAGGGGVGTGKIEFLLECLLDESAMRIPSEWRSRVPFTFSSDITEKGGQGEKGGVEKGGGEKGDKGVDKGDKGGGAKKGKEEEKIVVLPVISSLHPSLNPSSVVPQFQWQVDVLAGTVLELSHDTYDLERQIETKNQWEELSLGRAERAITAMTFNMERKALKNSMNITFQNNLQNSLNMKNSLFDEMTVTDATNTATANNATSGNNGHNGNHSNHTPLNTAISTNTMNTTASATTQITQNTQITPTPAVALKAQTDRLIDLLSLALEREEGRPLLAEREARLIALEEYKEFIGDAQLPETDSGISRPNSGISSRSASPSRIESSVLQAMKHQTSHRKEATEMASRQIGSLVLELNEMLRGDASQRVSALASQAADTAARLAILWEAREQYRQTQVVKVQAQRALLEKQAAEQALMNPVDVTKEDAKDKKGAKGKAPPIPKK